MIKILDSSKTLPNLVTDTTNGLGRIDPISCLVTEELNGIYECEFTILSTDKHFGDLSVGGIVKVPVNEAGNEQMFRIYYISKPMNEVVEVKCQHISYDLNKVPVAPFSATGSVEAKNGMLSHIMVNSPFTMTTDIENTTSEFVLDIPRSFRECLGGYEGSLLDTFRGEYEYDNLTVRMLGRRGADNGVRIAYGKNLTDFTQEENNENVYTSVLGYAVVNDVTYTGNVFHKITSTYPKVKIVDFSGDYSSEGGEGASIPTIEELTAKAQQYANRNSIEVPKVNISISFVPLYQTEEYKNIAPLERVSLGDTVHVYFDKLDVEASSRVIKTVWNSNLNRYDSVELGSARANLNTVIDDAVETAVDNSGAETVSFLENEIRQMTNLMANGLGLHVSQDEAGRIILHNAETIEDSQYQYMITAQGFMLSENYGQTWSSGWTTSGDAVLNSLSTITLKALEIYGSYIEGGTLLFGDPDGKYISVYPTTASQGGSNGGVQFRGSGSIRFRPMGEFLVTNVDENGDIINQLDMHRTSSTSYTNLINYYTSGVMANEISAYTQGETSSRLMLTNYTNTGEIASTIYNDWNAQMYLSSISVEGLNSGHTGADVVVKAQSDGNYIELKTYNSSGTLVTSITMNSANGNIYITGNHLYFNGSQKW